MEMMKRVKDGIVRHKYFVSGIVLIAVLTMVIGANILLAPGTIMYGDFNTPGELDRFELYPMWTQYGHYPNLDKVDRLLGFGVPLAFAMLLNIPADVFIKMMIWGTLLIAGLASYTAAFWMGRRTYPRASEPALCIAALCISLIYMFNPWSMNRIEHFFLWTGYAVAPLILVGAMKGLEEHNPKILVITGLLWAVASTSTHYTVFFFILILGAFLYQNPIRMRWPQRWALLRSSLILLMTFLIVSMYWIIPYVLTLLNGSGGPSTVLTVDVVNMLSANSSPLNSFRGIGYWWPRVDMMHHGGLESLWTAASYLVPILAFSSLLFRRDRLTIFLATMAIVFFFLSMGTNWPLGSFYSWLTFDAPLSSQLGWMLRDPDKWAGLLWLTYIFLIMLALLGLSEAVKTHFPRWSGIKREAVAMGIVCIMVLSCFTVFAGPSVNGYLNDIYSPVEIPSEYISTNQWLADQEGDFNVVWLPTSLGLSTTWTDKMVSNIENMYSGKAAIGGTTTYGAYYRAFLTESLAENRTDHFGRLLASGGIKYLIIREDVPVLDELVQLMEHSLSWQKDMVLVREDGAIKVYESLEDASPAYATNNIISVLGGISDLRSLYRLEGFDPNKAGVLFPQQTLGPSPVDGTWLISNARQEDLVLLYGAGTVLAPYDNTYHHDPGMMWSKASTLSPLHGYWRDYIEVRVNDRWQSDYGKGLVLTWANETQAGASIDVPLSVLEDGYYRISYRYFENIHGGAINLLLDGENLTHVNTQSEVKGFDWGTVTEVYLTAGEHKLTAVSEIGFNALNLFMVTNQSEWDAAIASARNALSGSDVAYLLEVEDSTTSLSGGSKIKRDGSYSQGRAVLLSPGQGVTGQIDVLDGMTFRAGIDSSGEVELMIDEVIQPINGTSTGISYSGEIDLAEGEHTITMFNRGSSDAIVDAVWLFSSQEITLEAMFNGGTSDPAMKHIDVSDPTSYKMDIDAEGRFLLVAGTVYDNNWVARSGNTEVTSIPAEGYLNGFILNGSGETTVIVYYKPQSWLYIGAAVSIGGALLFFPALALWSRRSGITKGRGR